MKVSANARNLEKLGRFFVGKPFNTSEELQEFADQQGIVRFIARLAIAEYNFLGDIEVDLDVPNEEMDRRIDDMFEAARAVCKLKH